MSEINDIKQTYENFKNSSYKSPVAAAIWSILMPGFGQLYNRDYIIGIILLTWEITVNLLGNVNLSIYYSFIREPYRALQTLDYRWALFYPSLYTFNIWHAFDRAKEINYYLEKKGVPKPPKYAYGTSTWLGFMLGMFFGLHWTFLVTPIFSSITLGIAGGIIGYVSDKIYTAKMKN